MTTPVDYIEIDDFKQTLGLVEAATFADDDIERAIKSASRAIDNLCNRRFYPDADAQQVRYYSPIKRVVLDIDDLIELTKVEASNFVGSFDGVGATEWTQLTDFTLVPDNAPADGRPYERIQLRPYPFSSRFMPVWTQRSVRVTGKFGWVKTPDAIIEATGIIAAQFLRRAREAPFGILTFGVEGQPLRLGGKTDAQLDELLEPYIRFVWAI
jgi:hypothetical protein